MFISMQILIFHPMRSVNLFAYSQRFQRFRGPLIHGLVIPDEVYFFHTK